MEQNGGIALKLTIERNALAAALAKITAIVDRRGTIPIISHVLLRAENDKLSIPR